MFANDELFAERENLIKPYPPEYQPYPFGHKGHDGWETRCRRQDSADEAIVRLGLPGVVPELIVDTTFFKGNYPPEVSVQDIAAECCPSPLELQDAVGRNPCRVEGSW